MATEENNLVRQLTGRLEQLQREKDQLERAVEGQGDAIALKLRLALLAYEQQKPQALPGGPLEQQRLHRRASKSSRTGSSSSSLSTSASTSSSVSFPSSPSSSSASALVSPILPAPDLTPDVLLALRENETLRVRLANSERVNAYYQRELAELRRRCGISIDELEELDLSSPLAAGPSGSGGSYPRQRSLSRTSRLDMYGGPSSSSIRIPGAAASVSPPGGGGGGGGGTGRRSLTSSFMFSPDGARSARFASESYTSSINTTATTPSSSYPNPRPPAATPATLAAFSPASANTNPNGTLALGLGGAPGLGFGSNFSTNGFAAGPSAVMGSSPQQLYQPHPQGFAERRNSLNGLVAAHFSNSLHQSDASGGTGTGAGTGIDVDDLVSLGGSADADADADEVNSANGSRVAEVDGQTTAVPPTTTGSAEEGRDTSAAFPNPTSQLAPFPTAASTAPSLNGTAGTQAPTAASAAAGAGGGGGGELSVDPLVAAITRSLAKLVAEGSATLVDESSSSSEGGGDGEEVAGAGMTTGEEGEETDGDDGAETPLSSGASRTGSMRRRYFC